MTPASRDFQLEVFREVAQQSQSAGHAGAYALSSLEHMIKTLDGHKVTREMAFCSNTMHINDLPKPKQKSARLLKYS